MAGLVNGKKELKLPWRGSFLSLATSDQDQDLAARMKAVLGQFTDSYKRLMENREREMARINRRLEIGPDQFCRNDLVSAIKTIWNDHSIREAYDRRREFPKYFVENVPYYIDNLDRIGRIVIHWLALTDVLSRFIT